MLLQNEYETVIIIRPDLDDAVTQGIVENLKTVIAENGGTLLYPDDWGKKKLAYPIKRHQKGHYVLFSYCAAATMVAEFERKIRNQDDIIRFLTAKVGEAVDVDDRKEKALEFKAKRDAERARLEALQAEEDAKRFSERDDDYYGDDD